MISFEYTVLHMFTQLLFWAMGMKQKYIIFEKKIPKWPTHKKLSFTILPILNTFFQKFHGLVLGLVRLIDAKGIDMAQPIWP